MHPVSIVGCGYTGQRLARRWLELGHPVRGFGRREQSLRDIRALGAEASMLDLDQALDTALEIDAHLIYYLVPPAPAGERDDRLERLLAKTRGTPRRIVYLSTTGVYGDRRGAPVDEETPPAPASARAIRRLAAEFTLRAWADTRAFSWSILRVPGIYGPGRLPLERLRRGDPAIVPAEATPTNRIHVDDLAAACVAAGCTLRAHARIYNITDGSDDSLTAYLQRVARVTGLPPPPLISRSRAQAEFSATSWSFLTESRRVDNRRMLHELGVEPAYRDLDAGIRASLQ